MADEEPAPPRTLKQLQREHALPPVDFTNLVRSEHEEQSGFRNYVRDITLGFNDGVVSVFALVAGLAGYATMAPHEIGVAGAAASIAGSLSMGIGEYLSTKSQAEYYQAEARRERDHIRKYRELELQEMRALLKEKNYPDHLVDPLIEHVAADDERFVEFMMREEFGVGKESFRSAWRAAWFIMAAFLVGAAIPVIPFFFAGNSAVMGIALSTTLAFCGLFMAGIAKARVSGLNVWRSAIEMSVLGSLAALVTFGVGKLFHASV